MEILESINSTSSQSSQATHSTCSSQVQLHVYCMSQLDFSYYLALIMYRASKDGVSHVCITAQTF